jgi:hypothetical protein
MPVKTKVVLEEHLRNIPLPTHGASYAVVSHGQIIDLVVNELYTAGFIVKEAQYKCSLDGQIAQGTYHLEFSEDPDMGLSFAWINSYNKQRAFKCAIGGHVFACMNGVMSGELGTASRRHSGSALVDVKEYIKDQISFAKQYYRQLCSDKNILKTISLTPAQKGTILGRLFSEYEILTLTQVGIVKREIDKPSFNYSNDPNSAWDMYNHVTVALKESHPQSYIEDHQRLHEFFVNEFMNPTTTSAQLELEFEEKEQEVIEVEAEELVDLQEFGNYGVVFN